MTDRKDVFHPPAAIFYWCLLDVQRLCVCTILDQMLGRDCGVQVLLPRRPTGQR